MRTNTGLTIYNRFVSGGAELYQRHQIARVAWKDSKGSNVRATGGYADANQATISIPAAFAILSEGTYLEPVAWRSLVSKTGKWTLQIGDIVVKGLISVDVEGSYTIETLRRSHDHVLTVASVDYLNNGSSSLWHWKVGAR